MKIWVIVTTPFSGGSKKLIRAFDTQHAAEQMLALVEQCDPRVALSIETIELERASLLSAPADPNKWTLPGVAYPWVQPVPATCVSLNGFSSVPESPAASFAQPEEPSKGPTVYEEPMEWQWQDGR